MSGLLPFSAWLALTWVGLTGLVAGESPPEDQTPGSRMRVRIDGLACPFCVYGVEKKLKALPGVQKVQVHLKDGVAILTMKPGERPDPGGIRKAVEKAGFKASEIQDLARPSAPAETATLRGWIERRRTKFLLLTGEGSRYALLSEMSPDGEGTLGPDMAAKLRRLAEGNREVRIKGSVQKRQDGSSALLIERLEALP